MGYSPPPRVPGTLIAVHVSPVFAAATAPGAGELQDFLAVTQSDEKPVPAVRQLDALGHPADACSPEQPSSVPTSTGRVVTVNGLRGGAISGQRANVP